MADVITRFKLETTQFDSKLRDASNGMAELVKKLAIAGKDFNKFAQNSVEQARALGKIESGAASLKDRLNDLVGAYNRVAQQYNALTQEQKNGDFGKALSESLKTLQGRITQTKTELYNFGGGANNTGGIMDQLAKKFTLNIDVMKLFNVGLKAVNGALDVAKDALFSNEQQLDEWSRVIESSRSVYRGFLDALNTGDISGFISNIDNIVRAARDAYDALDELNTFNAFNQRNVARTQRGLSEAIVDYREGKGTKEQVRAAGDAYKNELQQRMKLENEAYIKAVNELAQQRGIKADDLMKVMSGSYGDYQQLKSTPLTGVKQSMQFLGPGQAQVVTSAVPANEIERLGEALRRLNDTELKSLQALGAQADRTGNEIAQVDRQITRVMNGRGGSSSGSGVGKTIKDTTIEAPKGSMAALMKEVQELQKAQLLVTDPESWKAYADEIDKVKAKMEKLKGVMAAKITTDTIKVSSPESMESLKANLSGYQKDLSKAKNYTDYLAAEQGISHTQEQIEAQPLAIRLGIDADSAIQVQEDINTELEKLDESLRGKFQPIKITADTKGLKAGTAEAIAASKEFQSAAGAISSIGTALQTIEDPAAKVMGIVAQAIATVALTFAKSLEKTFTPWDWIAAAAAGAATMISTISAIKSATDGGYAEGGIVPGDYFSGDMLRTRDYGIESGELILNRAQQNNIADQLTTGRGDSRGGAAQPFVTGQYIFLGTNNYLKSSGQGQLVTTSMLRAKGINI